MGGRFSQAGQFRQAGQYLNHIEVFGYSKSQFVLQDSSGGRPVLTGGYLIKTLGKAGIRDFPNWKEELVDGQNFDAIRRDVTAE